MRFCGQIAVITTFNVRFDVIAIDVIVRQKRSIYLQRTHGKA